jgi:heme/copper-type cytochrome/quinol oxidase subunit 2
MTMTPLRPSVITVAALTLAAASIQLASAQAPASPASPASPAAPAAPAQSRKVVHVVAERFAFAPSEIVVEEGTLLEIQLRSDDTNHGFRIKGTTTNVVIPKRGRGAMTVTFDALTPGRYAFECSKMCGAGHSMMKGAIVVKPRQAPTTPSAQAAAPVQGAR